jgi:hypothetical protein
MLRGLFNEEKNNFIESCTEIISGSISEHIIENAKLNITHILFDFSCEKHIEEKINKIRIESTNLYLSLYPYLKHDDYKVIEYTQEITREFSNKCYSTTTFNSNNIHYPKYLIQDIATYDEGGVNIIYKPKYPRLSNYYTLSKLYNISDDLIIKLIIDKLKKTFTDINIEYIDDDLDCCSYYLISW